MSERIVCHGADVLERAVVRVWRRSHRAEGTSIQYLHLIRRFRDYCRRQGLDEMQQLTLRRVEEFARWYVGPRLRRSSPERVLAAADNAVFAWAYALRHLGHQVPAWRTPQGLAPLPPLIAEFVAYRRTHRGVAASTLVSEASTAVEFLAVLKRRRRSLSQIRASDLDAFVAVLGQRLCRRTVRDTCSRLRGFLRFLHATGRTGRDVASLLVAPRVRPMESPPRVLPWLDVQRLLQSVPRDRHTGLRDFALLLMMITYGFGAAEVVSLRLEWIDWRADALRLQRPKTGAPIELPLLPAVARALIAYLRKARPANIRAREIFVGVHLTHRAMSTSAVRHLVRYHAKAAGIAAPIGAHSLRHTHATRQVDGGANLKIVGDILGHRRPASTSVYTRVALNRLRAVALPVPR